MCMSKKIVGVIISVLFSTCSMAANQGSGKITFKGEIVAAPCSVHPEDVNQTVLMGSISDASVKNGNSPVKNFGIRLIGCDTQKYKADGSPDGDKKFSGVKVGFTGTSINNGMLLKIDENIGIELTHGGVPLTLGVASPKIELTGDQEIHFGAQVKAVSKAGIIKYGSFSSVANFSLFYE